MAVLANPTILLQGNDPGYRYALVAFRGVTTGDTFDFAALGFNTVFGAEALSPTERTQVPVTSVITTNTIVTVSTTGLAKDSVLILAVGD
jgi:hypothetical protein